MPTFDHYAPYLYAAYGLTLGVVIIAAVVIIRSWWRSRS